MAERCRLWVRPLLVCTLIAAVLWPDNAPAVRKPLSELDAVYLRGLKARDVPAVVTAAKVLERALEDYPDHAGLILNRVGMLYLRVGRAGDARSAFERAVGFDPKLATAHCGLGRVALELERDPEGALPHLEAALKADSTYTWTHTYLARALAQVGRRLLTAGAPDSARSAFERALGFETELAMAHSGLGRLALEQESDPALALLHLDAALRADSTHAETHYLIARVYQETGRPGARQAADRALQYNARFAPAHLLLAESHREEGDVQAAMVYFEKYLELKPADQKGALAFASELLEKEKFREVEALTSLMSEDLALPLLAQALMARGDYEGALRAFKVYVESLDPEEQALYRDVSLVGLPHEIEAWRNTPPEKRAAFLQRFWLRRDPFKASRGAMRRAEHYRRVWYARTNYGTQKWPWDRRGEVYIRYGDPDYRSSSIQPNPKVPPAVERVQDHMAYQLYGTQGLGISFVGPVFPIRTDLGSFLEPSEDIRRDLQTAVIEELDLAVFSPDQEDPGAGGNPAGPPQQLIDLEDSPIEAGIDLDPEFAIGLSGWKPVTTGHNWASVPWEVWVYASVGKGLEVAFTDERNSGVYDYAPVPGVNSQDLKNLDKDPHVGQMAYVRLMQRLTELAPSTRVASVSREEPEYYSASGFEALDFSYDVVTFRGKNGGTEIQVNVGIPVEHVALPGDTDDDVMVNRRVALMDARYTKVLALQQDLEVPVSGRRRDRALLDRVDLLDVLPGDYELALQVQRHNTKRLQAYSQELSVEDYSGDGLKLSDLFVARQVTAAMPGSDPKFVRGKWNITPLPSHVFDAGQHVFVFFEIYNLAKDEFGATRYEVVYEVYSTDESGTSLSRLTTRVLGRSESAVTVRYEQTGTEASVSDYVALDIGETAAGRRRVRMAVKDMHSGQRTTKEGLFWVREATR
ncbi:MAG: tetratricopeptide repeat protein [Gemmatimonadota bacterium]|nr:tetratricopeptide repeat protein [Gemmatimonadota bacterium]